MKKKGCNNVTYGADPDEAVDGAVEERMAHVHGEVEFG